MKIGLDTFVHAVNVVGTVNPTAKRVSKQYDFFKDVLMSGFVLLLGIAFMFFIWFVGIALIGVSALIFLTSLKHKRRFYRIQKMREELKGSPSLDEKVSVIFTDLDSGQGRNKQGFKDERENVLILTEKRLIFMHVPLIGYSDVTSGNLMQSIGRVIDYDGLKKKVQEEVEKSGIRKMIKEHTAYAMNYDDISEVKVNSFFGSATITYRSKKFRYHLRRNQIEQFRQVFANYIKN